MKVSEADVLNDWIETTLSGKSPATRSSYKWAVQRFWKFLQGRKVGSINELKTSDIKAFFADLRMGGANQNTVANLDRTLRAIFNRLDLEGREDFDLSPQWQNPFTTVDKNRPITVLKTPLTSEQANKLLSSVPRQGLMQHRNYAMAAFMLMTGARSIEVRHLLERNVDLDHAIAKLEVTKGSTPRYVHMPDKLCKILRAYLRRRARLSTQCPYIFMNRSGKPQSRRALHRAIRTMGSRIGITDLGPHRLRHSYVTLSHAKGAPLKFLQEQCGHSSILMTQRYISLSAQQKTELANEYCAL
jgi:site-specific recombinase XerD